MLWVSMKMEMKWILMEFLFISMEVHKLSSWWENGQIYVDKLTTKTIGTIVLTACDTGNLDYSKCSIPTCDKSKCRSSYSSGWLRVFT